MLKKLKPEKLDVLSTCLERNMPLPIYSKLENTLTGASLKNKNDHSKYNSSIYCIYDFPDYLKGYIDQGSWKAKSINTYEGSLILLKNYKNTGDYLKRKFSKDRLSKFRTYQQRLEISFNINYKTYFGNIDKKEYQLLFAEFREMTKKRFLEKKIQNHDLTRWQIYEDIAYPLINSRDAVLFVIFSDHKPISICLNFIKGKTIYGYLRTYDVDYSKFYLGYTDFIKQLNWCYENNLEVFDLLKGIYPYKLKIVDKQYYFQKHILYDSSSLLASIYAKLIIFQTIIFNILLVALKKIKINKLYYWLINYSYRVRKLKAGNSYFSDLHFKKEIVEMPSEQLVMVDLNKPPFDFLKREVYNFLYSNKESLNNVQVFKLDNEPESFIIKGKNKIEKINLIRRTIR